MIVRKKIEYINLNSKFITIDVEDWFHILNTKIPDINQWDKLPSIVEKGVQIILDILEEYNNKATFFILGWIAKKYPNLVKEIHNRGHEVASHGFYHKELYLMNDIEIINDIKDSKMLLEDIIGEKIVGYRSPGFSFSKNYFNLLESLMELDFIYDSSVFPKKRETGGDKSFKPSPFIYFKEEGKIYEFPISVYKKVIKIPFGGGYSRIMPSKIMFFLLKKIKEKNQYFLFYFHPREIVKDPPKLDDLHILKYFKTYIGINGYYKKIVALNRLFKFNSIKDVLKNFEKGGFYG